jgi:hypothetical protein
MWLPALRRMVKLFLVVSGLTILLSASFGLLVGASILRSISIGFYLVGCFVLIGAFFFGNRGPVRSKGDVDAGGGILGLGTRRLRWATSEEHEEAVNAPAVLLPLGIVLILLGIAWDPMHSLF